MAEVITRLVQIFFVFKDNFYSAYLDVYYKDAATFSVTSRTKKARQTERTESVWVQWTLSGAFTSIT